jgi:hypothetical protein
LDLEEIVNEIRGCADALSTQNHSDSFTELVEAECNVIGSNSFIYQIKSNVSKII